MKLIELLNKIANGEIKEETKCIKDGKIDVYTKEYYTMLNEEVEIIEEKQQEGRWKPKEGEDYWHISAYGQPQISPWKKWRATEFLGLTKNVFKTEQEAKEYLKYKTALLEAEKPFVKNEMNYKLTFSTINRKLYLNGNYDDMSQGSVYLGTDINVAQAFIDKWCKQILKYEFSIEE